MLTLTGVDEVRDRFLDSLRKAGLPEGQFSK